VSIGSNLGLLWTDGDGQAVFNICSIDCALLLTKTIFTVFYSD